MPSYDILEKIFKLHIDINCSEDEIIEMGFTQEVVMEVLKIVKISQYKRKQEPIGTKITARSFGKDRRIRISY